MIFPASQQDPTCQQDLSQMRFLNHDAFKMVIFTPVAKSHALFGLRSAHLCLPFCHIVLILAKEMDYSFFPVHSFVWNIRLLLREREKTPLSELVDNLWGLLNIFGVLPLFSKDNFARTTLKNS